MVKTSRTVRAACEAALREGNLETLRALNEPQRGGTGPSDPLPEFYASHYLSGAEAVRAIYTSLVIKPSFQRGLRRLSDLLDPSPAVRRRIEAGIIPDDLIPDDLAAPAFRGQAEWVRLPDEPGLALPEPINALNETFPIPLRERIEPVALKATLVEDGYVYRDGQHFQAFSDGAPLHMADGSRSARLVVAAAKRLVERGEVMEFSGTVHVISSPGPRSFYHWLLDIVPLLHAAKTLFPDVPVETVVTNGSGLPFQNGTLRLVAPKATIVEVLKPTVIRAPRIVYAAHQNGLGRTMPSFALDFWRTQDTAARSQRERLFIARQPGAGRALIPAGRAEAIARERGFHIVHMEDFALREQFALFSGASVVAGVHGAGLSHALFMRPRSVLVEVFGDHMTPSFRYLAGRSGVHHVPVSMSRRYADVSKRDLRERDQTRFADVPLDADRLAAALDLAIAVAGV